MLKKLIKHEFKDTMRLFIPMFGFIVVLTPIFSLMMSLGSQPYDENTADALSLVFGSGIIGYCLLLFGLLIVTQVLIAIRFYKTMTSQEAYLTFTLPAKTGQLLLAKWLVSFVWYILACGIALISMLIVVLIATPITLSEIIHGIGFVLQTINLSDFSALVLLGIFMLISLSFSILMMYLSIMIGQLVQTHRIALSIGAYLGLSQGLQIVISLLSIPFILIFPDVIDSIHVVLLLFCLLYGALGVIFYLLTYLITAKISHSTMSTSSPMPQKDVY